MIESCYNATDIQQKFKNFYEENLQSEYKNLEDIRKIYLKKFYNRIICFTAFIIFLILICFILNSLSIIDLKMVAGLIFIVTTSVFLSIFYYQSPIFIYKNKTKSLVMDKILSFFGCLKYKSNYKSWGDLEYKSNQISLPPIEKSELFARIDNTEIDDYFHGKYKDTNINVSEIKLSHGKGRSKTIIFKGIIILFDFNKNFKGKTIVRGKKIFFHRFKLYPMLSLILAMILTPIFIKYYQQMNEFWKTLSMLVIMLNLYMGLFADWLLKRSPDNTDKQTIKLEEFSFNENWQIFSDNQIEARYILTPILMEKINHIKNLFKGEQVDFSFFDNKLMIAIHTNKDMFETTSLFKTSLEYKKVKEVVCQLHSIFSVIDTLKKEK